MKYQKEVVRSFTMVLQFGINMLVPIMLCMFLGIFLDRLLHTSFIAIVLFFLGALAGFRNVYICAKQMNGKPSALGSDAGKRLKDNVESIKDEDEKCNR